jgi:hypothetical protein
MNTLQKLVFTTTHHGDFPTISWVVDRKSSYLFASALGLFLAHGILLMICVVFLETDVFLGIVVLLTTISFAFGLRSVVLGVLDSGLERIVFEARTLLWIPCYPFWILGVPEPDFSSLKMCYFYRKSRFTIDYPALKGFKVLKNSSDTRLSCVFLEKLDGELLAIVSGNFDDCNQIATFCNLELRKKLA